MAAPAVARLERLTRQGFGLNAGLAVVKLTAGILGNSYALVADAVESITDLVGSAIVWGGLRISGRQADRHFPFGYGRIEALTTIVVGLMLLAAAVGIAIEAVREIRTPHHAPAPFTLVVLVAVVAVKVAWSRHVMRVARQAGSGLVAADAWHHQSDAITSVAAFLGISIALIGGQGWESADDYAALLASGLIFWNGLGIVRPAVAELMDRAPSDELLAEIDRAARTVPEVLATEKIRARKIGTVLAIELHVQSDPALSLHEAHIVSGKVKSAIRRDLPAAHDVLVHMEPFEE
ncbi:MAG: cation transporter [Gemmatimonadales bacterium]|nr:cation transporter [Gemmatimonadales bacterium]